MSIAGLLGLGVEAAVPSFLFHFILGIILVTILLS